MARNTPRVLRLLMKQAETSAMVPEAQPPMAPSPSPEEGAIGVNSSPSAAHNPTTTQAAKSPVTKQPAPPAAPAMPTTGAQIAASSPAKTSRQKFAAVIPTGREMPQPGQQQEEGVDETVKRKMQYKWRDKMQKIDQGMSKLELQREQTSAEMQLEEQQLQQTEQLKKEQKDFDNSVKEKQRQQKINDVLPQHPMGMPAQEQGGGMQQQQPGLARQQPAGPHQMPQMPKMASEERLQSALNTLWNKSEIDAESYEKGYRDGKVSLEDIELLAKGHAGDSDLYSEGSKPYAMKQASEDKWTRRTKKITRCSENMILKIAGVLWADLPEPVPVHAAFQDASKKPLKTSYSEIERTQRPRSLTRLFSNPSSDYMDALPEAMGMAEFAEDNPDVFKMMMEDSGSDPKHPRLREMLLQKYLLEKHPGRYRSSKPQELPLEEYIVDPGYDEKTASEDKWTRRTKKITRCSENMILKIAEEEDWDLGDEAAGFAGTVGGMFAGGAAGREVGGRPGMMAGAIGGSLLGNVVAVAIQRAARRKKNILQPPTGVGFMI